LNKVIVVKLRNFGVDIIYYVILFVNRICAEEVSGEQGYEGSIYCLLLHVTPSLSFPKYSLQLAKFCL